MKRIIFMALVFLLSAHGYLHASDITWANKITGSTVTAADFNEIKTAVNSKPDSASEIVILFASGSCTGLLYYDGTCIDTSIFESSTSDDFDPDRLAGDTVDDDLIDGAVMGECNNSKGALPDTTGIAAGYTPTAVGDGTVSWTEPVSINGIPSQYDWFIAEDSSHLTPVTPPMPLSPVCTDINSVPVACTNLTDTSGLTTKYTEGETAIALSDDATPDVSNGGTGVASHLFTTGGTTTITDFDDGDDHSEFTAGDWFNLICAHATPFDFSDNSNMWGNLGYDYTCHVGEIIQFELVGSQWRASIGVGPGAEDTLGFTADGWSFWDFSEDGWDALYPDTTLQIYSSSGWKLGLSDTADDDAIEFVIDGGGSAITTGVKGCLEIPWAGTISAALVTAPIESGSIQIDVWVDSFANFPPTVADTITASAPIVMSSAQTGSSALTGWTTALTKGQWICFNVDSVTSTTLATVSLKVDR